MGADENSSVGSALTQFPIMSSKITAPRSFQQPCV
jgi:hypothetical protein